ncbi:MAG: hypothetical protein V4713_06975 [Pseudomonadota bacterium]
MIENNEISTRMKSRAIIAHSPGFDGAGAWQGQYQASPAPAPASPTKSVDNFVSNWSVSCRQAAPGLAYDRLLTNEAMK